MIPGGGESAARAHPLERDERRILRAALRVAPPARRSFVCRHATRRGLSPDTVLGLLDTTGTWGSGPSTGREDSAVSDRRRRGSLRAGTVLADRYALGPRIGVGGFGVVHEGLDLASGRPVAVKAYPPRSRSGRASFRREASMLRRLRLPGVVQILEEGIEGGTPYVVTEIVDGTPFPGDGCPSRDVPARFLELTRIVARLHAFGILHGDLKPDNVMVTAGGAVTVIDLGIAEEEGDSPVPHRLRGTPAFLAPERLRGGPPTPATDLYALGVMLFFALTGRRPHADEPTEDHVRRRRGDAPRPVSALAADAPRHLSRLAARLLAPRPTARPPRAADVVMELAGAEMRASLEPLGRTLEDLVGREDRAEATRRALHAFVEAPSRILPVRTRAVEHLLRRTDGWPSLVTSELTGWIASGLATVERGRVRLTASMLARIEAFLPVTPPPGPELDLAPADAEVLAILRLLAPEATPPLLSTAVAMEPAALLETLERLRATGGVRETADGRWLPAYGGVAWSDLVPGRREEMLDRLAIAPRDDWPDRLRMVVPPATEPRAFAEWIDRGEEFLSTGRARGAVDAFGEALRLARRRRRRAWLRSASERLLRAGLACGDRRAFDTLLYSLGPGTGDEEEHAPVRALGLAALRATEGFRERALHDTDPAVLPLPPSLEPHRAAIRGMVAQAAPIERHRHVLAESLRLARRRRDARRDPGALADRGWLAYRQRDYRRAAALADQAARHAPTPNARASALLNASNALLDAGELHAALDRASEAESILAAHHHAVHAVRACWLRRSALYRSGTPLRPDRELVDEAAELGTPYFHGLMCMTEATYAWRRGQDVLAGDLAAEGADVYAAMGTSDLEVLLAALHAAATGSIEERWLPEPVDAIRACRLPGVSIQAAALLAEASPSHRGALAHAVEMRWRVFRGVAPEGRREVLSPRECRRRLESAEGLGVRAGTPTPDPATASGSVFVDGPRARDSDQSPHAGRRRKPWADGEPSTARSEPGRSSPTG